MPFFFDVYVAMHHDKFLIIEPTRCTNFSKFFYFRMKLYMFQMVPLSVIRSFPLHTQQWYMLYRFAESLQQDPACKLSANLYDIYHCCVCAVLDS